MKALTEAEHLRAAQVVAAIKSLINHRDNPAQFQKPVSLPSLHYQTALPWYDYILEGSYAVINRLRIHCYHFTSDTYGTYVHGEPGEDFTAEYKAICEGVPQQLIVKPPEILGEFGWRMDGHLVNKDLIRFQRVVRHLWEHRILDQLSNAPRCNVIEIGAGWGALGYYLKAIIPNCTYFIVDLPEILVMSGIYLSIAYPSAKIFVYDMTNSDSLLQDQEFDFVLIPNFALEMLDPFKFDLAINVSSFQEMSEAQVTTYVNFLAERLQGRLYSHNMDKHPWNDELGSVSEILTKYFDLEAVSPGPTKRPVIERIKRGIRHPGRAVRAFNRSTRPGRYVGYKTVLAQRI